MRVQHICWYVLIAMISPSVACVPLAIETPLSTSFPITVTLTLSAPASAHPYPIATRVMTPPEASYPGPTFDATRAATIQEDTQEAMLALRATGVAAISMTLTALPTYTPTPTIPVEAPPCRASDLQMWARAGGATGSIVFAVQITNTTQTTCYLQGPPDIKLVDKESRVLEIEYYSNCFLCNEPKPFETAVPALTQTAVVQNVLYGRIGMGPNEQVGVFMIWDNWCKPFPEGGIRLRLTLPDELGAVEGLTDAYVGGRCDAPDGKSYLMVSHYSYRP